MNQKSLHKQLPALLFVLLTLCFGYTDVTAQDMTVSGTIISSEDQLPLIGVTIMVAETTRGTTTDIDGKYSLKVTKGEELKFSYTGMEGRTETVDGPTLDLVMNPAANILEELVVIGYGTARKKELTGAVSQVKAEELQKVNTSDVASALQGQIAGVNVSSSSGAPGETANIQIRGVTSLNGSNTPLFVVDGIPQDGDPRLSRNEIETIDVLKDAASASIYGTRGAAGVILITTKQGSSGRTKVSLDTRYGIQTIGEGLPLMNAADQLYLDNLRLDYVDGAFAPQVVNNPEWLSNDTDLRNFMYNDNAPTQSYDLGITGGTKTFSYNVVAGLFGQEGIFINSGFTRYNARINTRYQEGRWNIRTSANINTEKNDRIDGGLLLAASRYIPYFPELNFEDTEFDIAGGESQTQTNFLVTRLKRISENNRDRINGSLNISYDITKNLKFNTNVGGGITNVRSKDFSPPFETFDVQTGISEIDPTLNFIEQSSSRARNYLFDAGFSYGKWFGKHNVKLLASYSVDERDYEWFQAGRQGLASETIQVINIGTINPYANSGEGFRANSVIRTMGLIGRAQYNYADRYLFSASIRRDGSSKFAEQNRWGIFPSVSAAWNISSEPFWKSLSGFSDNFKIRASYGTTGNESFPAYQFTSTVDQGSNYVFGDNLALGATQRNFANRLVKWETSAQFNIGLDIGLWQNKLTFTADFYDTRKRDMLFPIQLPASAGALSFGNSILTLNIGDMTNKGVELALNYRMSTGKARWNLGGVFSKNVNEITSINGETEIIYNSNSATILGDGTSVVTTLAKGREVGSYFLFKTDGTIQNEEELTAYQEIIPDARLGDLKYVDTNGDGSITELDREYSGSGLPDYEIGANVNVEFKGFDFTMQWFASVGHEIINGSAAYAYSFRRHQGLLNMWTPENPTSNIPIHRGDSKDHRNYAGTTDRYVEDGSYLRLRLASLGYTLPTSLTKKIGINNFRVYLSAQNPLTFTKYTGFDPEVGGFNVAQRGLDLGRYPFSRQMLFGLQFDF